MLTSLELVRPRPAAALLLPGQQAPAADYIPNLDYVLQDDATARGLSRRDFLGYSSLGLAVMGVTAACGGSGGGAPAAMSGPTGPPKRGGSFTLGASGGASTDTLDPHNGLTSTDAARLRLLYDPLVALDHQGKVEYVLAESITPDATATSYVIKVRDGVVSHDGQPFGAADVLWNFKRIVDKKLEGATPIGPIDFAATKILDATRLQLVYKTPFSILVDTLAGLPFFYQAARSWAVGNYVGTGAFKYQSFQPGVQSTFVRNDRYWDGDLPYLDKVTVLNMADETTQVNALLAGQVDAIDYLSAQSVQQLKSAGKVLTISQTGGWSPITLATNVAPFDDVRVRQAFRLMTDRKQINDVVFGGYGTVANDVFGRYDSLSTTFPQRPYDVAEAKSLLKSAGHENLSLRMITTDLVPWMRSVAQLYAQQAKAAGVNIDVQFQNSTTFFANSYCKVPFAQDYWFNMPYLPNAAGATVAGAPFNATFFDDKEYNKLYSAAVATIDVGQQADIVHQMQKIDFDRGGNIIPVFYPIIDGTSPKVGGVTKDVNGWPLGNWNYKELWLDQ